MALNVKLQLFRGLLANLPATTGAPGVLAWTTDSDELFIDTGTQFQRLAPGNQVFQITNPSQLTGLPALIGDIAVVMGGSPVAPQSTYMRTTFSSPEVGTDWVLISATGTDGNTDVIALPGATPHNFVTFIDASGVQHLAQPSFADISGQLAQTQLPTTIGAGTSLTDIDLGTF